MRARGWLIDVYETVVRVDLRVVGAELAAQADLSLEAFGAAIRPFGQRLTIGAVTWAEVFTTALRERGREPSCSEIDELVAAHERRLIEHVEVFDDGLDLLVRLRAAGVGTALVSNCAPHTRAVLDHVGISRLVDHMVLSCEVGMAKPDAAIYRDALDRLGVPASDAVMVDDQPDFCRGATALGMAAVQVQRRPLEQGDTVAWSRYDDLTALPVES